MAPVSRPGSASWPGVFLTYEFSIGFPRYCKGPPRPLEALDCLAHARTIPTTPPAGGAGSGSALTVPLWYTWDDYRRVLHPPPRDDRPGRR